MTWENVIAGALEGISRFVYDFCNIVFGCLNANTVDGLLGLGAIVIILRVANSGYHKTFAEFDTLNRLVEVRDKRMAI